MTEYGIARNTSEFKNEDMHRTGMTKDEAEEWMQDWLSGRGSPTEYCIVSREVSAWDLAD